MSKIWIKEQPTLFDHVQQRKEAQERAYEAAAIEWREKVYEFAVIHYLPSRTDTFIFQDLSQAYETYAKANNLPIHSEKRAFAGVQQRLKKERLIAVVDGAFARSYEGNLRPQYRSLITRG